MPNIRWPRHGSMQFWPRVRARNETARVRTWAPVKDVKPLGFAGYKVGMTHVIATDNRQHSMTKNQQISIPVSIIECPPLRIFGLRFYKNTVSLSQIFSDNLDKHLSKTLKLPKNKKATIPESYDDIRLLAHTQPHLTGIGKKKPEIFELGIGGKKEDKLKFAQEKLGKELLITEVFKDGAQVDIHAVTAGKGFQGPMKRFGIARRQHKSEKSIRNPGSLGGWQGQGQTMYRVAHAGKMGYHTRTEYNKQILKIGKHDELAMKGGWLHFGALKNPYVMIKGGIAGPQKRLIRLNMPIRPNPKFRDASPINYISLESKQ
ncbi:50S ribosomal protein L3 [Candidatus Woesearchaeota archaeon]|nr:50S ribosomal protein L3 [Candidatus Woesearchaeota archaeon]